jgi:formylglycine-generating enzyme required for sulfatase activity
VGSFLPNAFGLHDVHGNVSEWCRDSYGLYTDTPSDGSPFEKKNEEIRIYRGGGWSSGAVACRSAVRFKLSAVVRHGTVGLRPACSLEFAE